MHLTQGDGLIKERELNQELTVVLNLRTLQAFSSFDLFVSVQRFFSQTLGLSHPSALSSSLFSIMQSLV